MKTKLWTWLCAKYRRLFPLPTSDQKLVMELQEAVHSVARLGKEASRRGITVYLEGEGNLLRPEYIKWDQAFRHKREMLP